MKGLIFRLVLAGITLSAAINPLSAQCIEGNCRTGTGTFRFANSDRYQGTWSAGQMHGKGTYNFESGERYVGEFSLGKFSGRGTMYYPDGAYYTGDWKDNRKNGFGKLGSAQRQHYPGKLGEWPFERTAGFTRSVQQAQQQCGQCCGLRPQQHCWLAQLHQHLLPQW
ncbi:MAG: hypothetical protein IPL65_00535 [Lewinellaceae bacterium]|nr:hypothetical protein [Lewinellaceae bacterium]